MIVHLGTQIQSVFGRTDEHGNLVEQFAVSANQGKPVQVFSEAEFAKAFGEIAQARAGLEPVAEGGEPCPQPSE